METNKDLNRQVVNNAAYGKTNSAYPGQNIGLTLDNVKKFVDNAKKIQGTTFLSAVGTVTPSVQLPATAKMIVGIVFGGNAANTDTFTMLINEERAISVGSVHAFLEQSGKPQIGFYEFVRPVASSTSINLSYTSAAAGNNILFSVWYI